MSGSDDDAPRRREVAYRLFAAEFDDADFSFAESDEERAPNYVVTPTGARANRVFVVGVLTAVEQAGEDILRARVVDPTGAFVVYAGQYQPDAQAFFERADPPMFVAVSGKARTFQPDDSDVVYTSIRPESVNEVDADTRDRWVVGTAERTLDRIGVIAGALQSSARGDDLRAALEEQGVSESLAAGVPLAIDHYGTTGEYLGALRDLALDAARVVTGDVDEVEGLSLSPGAGGDDALATLAALDVDHAAEPETDEPAPTTPDATADAAAVGTAEGSTSETTDATAVEEPDDDLVEEPATSTGDSDDDLVEEPATSTGDSDDATTEEPVESAGDTEDATAGTVAAETADDDTAGTVASTTADAAADSDDTADSDDIGDFDPGEFELDDAEREEIEQEYGTEFTSGTDVDEPGEADIDTPDPEELAAAESEIDAPDEAVEAGAPAGAADADSAPESAGAPAGSAATTPDADDATGDAVSETPDTADDLAADEVSDADESDGTEPTDGDDADGDVDLTDAVMDAMADLDDGGGADRDAVISSVTETYGADPGDVEEAIQDALMDGRCYEPDDETLKPI